MQAVVFGGTFTANNVQLRTRQYVFAVNNQAFIITLRVASKWVVYQPVIEASVGTFSVKK